MGHALRWTSQRINRYDFWGSLSVNSELKQGRVGELSCQAQSMTRRKLVCPGGDMSQNVAAPEPKAGIDVV